MADQPWFDNETFELTVGEETTVVEAKQDKPLYTLEAEAFADVVQNGVESWTTMADTLGNMRALDELRRQVGLPVDELGNA
jgi:predicted dehydrogenase